MTNASMHTHQRSTRHLSVNGQLSPIPGDPVGELSYSTMIVNQNGTVMREEEIEQVREKLGFCTTCKGTPVKLFEVRKTKLNPLWKSREPLTVPNECYKGLCLKCHPNLEITGGRGSSKTTLESSHRSAEKNLTGTRYIDSELSGSIINQMTESLNMSNNSKIQDKKQDSLTSSNRGSNASRNTPEQLKDSVRVPGIPMDYNDSFISRRTSAPPSSSIPSEQRIDLLNLSRRDSVPTSIPAFDYKVAPMKRAPSPLKKSSPPNPVFDYKEVALKPAKAINPKKNLAGQKPDQATMDRLRAAYERTFSEVSIGEISALTLDLDHPTSSSFTHHPSRSETNDSDSILDEFSVPDFSMGTGEAVKSHRRQKPRRKPTTSKNHLTNVVAGSGIPSRMHPIPQSLEPNPRAIDKQRKPAGARSKDVKEFAAPDFYGDSKIVKPKAKLAVKPKNKEFVTSRMYVPMESSVSAIPGPADSDTRGRTVSVVRSISLDLDPPSLANTPLKSTPIDGITSLIREPTDTDTMERSLDPLSMAHASTMPPMPDFVREGSTYAQSLVDRIASIPSYEDASVDLEPPSLGGMTERESLGLKSEMSSFGDSSPEALESLINDVMAAENPDFLAELLGNTMRSQRESEAVQSLCLRTIREMSKYNDENKGCIMSTGLYECIMMAMKDHPDSVEVQERGCGSLWSLSVNQFNRVVLVRSGACERILRALDTHLRHEGLVQTALGALRTLSPEPEARLVIKHMLGCQRVVRVLALHRTVVCIQRDGCAFLSNVAVDMDNQVVSVVPKEELQAVVRAMADHLKNESVVTSACFALKNYTYEERNIRNLRRFEDVIALVEDAAQYATKASCRRDASEVLKRIRELRTEDDALEETAFSSLMQAMRRHNMDPNPARQVEESVSTITDVIKEYYWSIKLICFGFESLLNLMGKSEAYMSRILSPKTLRVVITTMKEHMSCPKVQERGCQLIKHLAEVDKTVNRTQICMEEGCSVLVNVLKQHRGYDAVQIPAYAALEALAKEPMCAEEIQRIGGWQISRDTESGAQEEEDDDDDVYDSGDRLTHLAASTSAFAPLPAASSS